MICPNNHNERGPQFNPTHAKEESPDFVGE